MTKCNCALELKVMFVCLLSDIQCPESKNQKFYCIECFNEGKHAHFPQVTIVGEVRKIHKKWITLRDNLNKTFLNSELFYKLHAPLIIYLENEMVKPDIPKPNR